MSAKRMITVYGTLGSNISQVETEATTWGELQTALNASNVSHTGMRVIIGQTQATLESAGATLPEGPFTLFLSPKKVKSGVKEISSMSNVEVREEVKKLIEKNGDSAKAVFNNGRNYTNKSSAELRDLLVKYSGKTFSAVSTASTPTDSLKEKLQAEWNNISSNFKEEGANNNNEKDND